MATSPLSEALVGTCGPAVHVEQQRPLPDPSEQLGFRCPRIVREVDDEADLAVEPTLHRRVEGFPHLAIVSATGAAGEPLSIAYAVLVQVWEGELIGEEVSDGRLPTARRAAHIDDYG